jgi:hypothetical protein
MYIYIYDVYMIYMILYMNIYLCVYICIGDLGLRHLVHCYAGKYVCV